MMKDPTARVTGKVTVVMMLEFESAFQILMQVAVTKR